MDSLADHRSNYRRLPHADPRQKDSILADGLIKDLDQQAGRTAVGKSISSGRSHSAASRKSLARCSANSLGSRATKPLAPRSTDVRSVLTAHDTTGGPHAIASMTLPHLRNEPQIRA